MYKKDISPPRFFICPSVVFKNLTKYGLDKSSFLLLMFLIDAQGSKNSSWYSHRKMGEIFGWYVTDKGECRLITKSVKALENLGLKTWTTRVTKKMSDGNYFRLEKHYDVRPLIERLKVDQLHDDGGDDGTTETVLSSESLANGDMLQSA